MRPSDLAPLCLQLARPARPATTVTMPRSTWPSTLSTSHAVVHEGLGETLVYDVLNQIPLCTGEPNPATSVRSHPTLGRVLRSPPVEPVLLFLRPPRPDLEPSRHDRRWPYRGRPRSDLALREAETPPPRRRRPRPASRWNFAAKTRLTRLRKRISGPQTGVPLTQRLELVTRALPVKLDPRMYWTPS